MRKNSQVSDKATALGGTNTRNTFILENKDALVTGAASGIGRAVALVWAREGAKVVVSDINETAGEETAALVRALGAEALFVGADVGKPEDSKNLVQRAVAAFGRLDVACNNAGIGGPSAMTADYPLAATNAMLVSAHPIGRLGRALEVAELVAWLSSDRASFVTGSYYPVDGGYLAR